MIQIHKILFYVSGISRFLQFFSGRGGAKYSILLGKVKEGRLLGQGHLSGRIQYFISEKVNITLLCLALQATY